MAGTSPPIQDLSRFLRRLEWRNRLSEDARAAILAIVPDVVSVPAGRDIVKPGQTVDHACLVEQGVVGRYERFRDGTRRTTMLYLPGDMADLHSIAFPTATWGLAAQSDTTIFMVAHDALAQLQLTMPQIALAFWRDTTADASMFSKWVSVLGRHQAHQRLAHLLCEFGLRMELAGVGSRDQFRLPISQASLAEVLGVTSTHVVRIFAMLRRDGLIATTRRSIQVIDRTRLEDVAEFDPGYLLLEQQPDSPISRWEARHRAN